MTNPIDVLRDSALKDMQRRFTAYIENQPFTLKESLGMVNKLRWNYFHTDPPAMGCVLPSGERAVFMQHEETGEWYLIIEPLETVEPEPEPVEYSYYNDEGVYIGESSPDTESLRDFDLSKDPLPPAESEPEPTIRRAHPVFRIAEKLGAFGPSKVVPIK